MTDSSKIKLTHTQRAAYITWKNAFIDECNSSQPPGGDYRPHVQPVNLGMVPQGAFPSVGLGCCCEKCKQ